MQLYSSIAYICLRDANCCAPALLLQIHTRSLVAGFFFLSLAVLWFPRVRTCNSILLTWLGMGPFEIALASLIIANAILHMPISPAKHQVKLHAWLQDHAWTEADLPRKLARPFTGEPCFCFETALKLLYFSLVVYDVEEVRSAARRKYARVNV